MDKTPGSLPPNLVVFKIHFDRSKIFQLIEMPPSARWFTEFNRGYFPVNSHLKRTIEENEIKIKYKKLKNLIVVRVKEGEREREEKKKTILFGGFDVSFSSLFVSNH